MKNAPVTQVSSDGCTVWINAVDGNVGRFGRFGIDVHTTVRAQMDGEPVCLACTHTRPALSVKETEMTRVVLIIVAVVMCSCSSSHSLVSCRGSVVAANPGKWQPAPEELRP